MKRRPSNSQEKRAKAKLLCGNSNDYSFCGIFCFKDEQDKHELKQNHFMEKEEFNFIEEDYVNVEMMLPTMYECDKSRQDYKSLLNDSYDDSLMFTNNFKKEPCPFCGLIVKSIWLLTIGERLPLYAIKDVLDKPQCPFGNFENVNILKLHKNNSFSYKQNDDTLKLKTTGSIPPFQHLHLVVDGKSRKKTKIQIPVLNELNQEIRCVREDSSPSIFVKRFRSSTISTENNNTCKGVKLFMDYISIWLNMFFKDSFSFLDIIGIDLSKLNDTPKPLQLTKSPCPGCFVEIGKDEIHPNDDSAGTTMIGDLRYFHFKRCSHFRKVFINLEILLLKKLLSMFVLHPVPETIVERLNNMWKTYSYITLT